MFVDEVLVIYEKKSDVKAGLSPPRDDIELEKCVREMLMSVSYLKRANADVQQAMTSIRD